MEDIDLNGALEDIKKVLRRIEKENSESLEKNREEIRNQKIMEKKEKENKKQKVKMMVHDIKMENEKKNREKLENIKRWKRDELFELKKILEE